jgi:enoyl-CoA hydratase/carnithine racemase
MGATPEAATIGYAARDGVAWITLQRPERRNAIDRATRGRLASAFAAAERDPDVRVIVLTGAGTAFCAGVDLKEGSPPDDAAAPDRLTAPLDAATKPVLAAINGPAAGGGFELALAADLRIASSNATFSLPEVSIGSLPGSGGTQLLARATTPARALRMLLTGQPIDAATALEWGIVSDVVAPEALIGLATTLASRIAANAPLSLQAAKRAARAAADVPLSSGIALERSLWSALAKSADHAEGRAAFREGRPPKFSGR